MRGKQGDGRTQIKLKVFSSMSFQIRDANTASCDRLTMGQCAQLAGCKKDEIDIALTAGQMRFYRVAGRRLVDPPDLRAWIMRRQGGFGSVR
jgi:hypothetical protein